MASGVDPRGHPIPASYERPAHYKLSSPSYCSYLNGRHGDPSKQTSRHDRQGVAHLVHHELPDSDHDRGQHVCGGGCAGVCGLTGGGVWDVETTAAIDPQSVNDFHFRMKCWSTSAW